MMTENDKRVEYTYPGYIPSQECREMLSYLNKKIKPYKIVFWCCFAEFLLFMILALIFFVTETMSETDALISNAENEPNYAAAIVFAVLSVVSVIAAIVDVVISSKYGKIVKYLKKCMMINERFSQIIISGYDEKEAYMLTTEWLERQALNQTLKDIAAIDGLNAINRISK